MEKLNLISYCSRKLISPGTVNYILIPYSETVDSIRGMTSSTRKSWLYLHSMIFKPHGFQGHGKQPMRSNELYYGRDLLTNDSRLTASVKRNIQECF